MSNGKQNRLLSISINVLMADGSTETRLLQNADLKKFCAVAWENLDGSPDNFIVDYYEVKGHREKAGEARRKMAAGNAVVLIKQPNCASDPWP